MSLGSYLTPSLTQFVFIKKILSCKKLLLILDVLILLTFEHVHIITAWCLIDFSEINDNGNFYLVFIFLLPGKLLYLAIWKSPLLQVILSEQKEDFHVANQNIYFSTL